MITYLILHRVFLFLCIINFILSLIFGISYAELGGKTYKNRSYNLSCNLYYKWDFNYNFWNTL